MKYTKRAPKQKEKKKKKKKSTKTQRQNPKPHDSPTTGTQNPWATLRHIKSPLAFAPVRTTSPSIKFD
jgi:hypothetical protein